MSPARLRTLLFPALAVLAVLGTAACGGGAGPAKNSIRGSTTNQLTRCTARDTTHACVLIEAQQKHPYSTFPNTPPPKGKPRVVTLPGGLRGIDFAWSCPDPNGIYGGAPVQFAISYVSLDSSKNWSKGCIDWWLSQHKRVGINWETWADRATNGYSAGYDDAYTALQQANYLLPGGAEPVIYSIDCDCSYGQVYQYFQGADAETANAGQGGAARVGDYGGYYPTSALLGAGIVRYGWATYAWSYGQWPAAAALEQWLNGNAFDLDRTIGTPGNDGLYPSAVPPPPLPDPYAVFPHTGYSFGKYKFNEYHAAIWHDRLKCRLPLRRAECFALNGELKALDGRLLFVAWNHPTPHGWVKNRKPDWHTADRGSRNALLSRRLVNRNPTHL